AAEGENSSGGIFLLARRRWIFVFISLQVRIEIAVERPAFYVLRQRIDAIKRKTEGFSHIADGAAGAVGDNDSRHAGPIAAVFVVDVLQHFLPPLVLEIDVDVGCLVPLLADKSL